MRCLIERIAKQAQKVIARKAGLAGDLLQIKRQIVAFVDKRARTNQPLVGTVLAWAHRVSSLSMYTNECASILSYESRLARCCCSLHGTIIAITTLDSNPRH